VACSNKVTLAFEVRKKKAAEKKIKFVAVVKIDYTNLTGNVNPAFPFFFKKKPETFFGQK